MIAKEKIVFWPLAAVFIGMLVFGFVAQEKKEEATKDLLKDIELATKKSRAKKKAIKDKIDLDTIRLEDTLENYKLLVKRSPFFRLSEDKPKVQKVEVVPVKKKPKKAALKYKGSVKMGSRVMVVIEDQGTGKSFFVKEGDTVADFLVVTIDEKEVTLTKEGGEKIILSAVKKENKKKKKDQAKEEEKEEK